MAEALLYEVLSRSDIQDSFEGLEAGGREYSSKEVEIRKL